MIIWIDQKSVLRGNGREFSAGEVVPAGLLTPDRINLLVEKNKIEIHPDNPTTVVTKDFDPYADLVKKDGKKKSKKGKGKKSKAGPKVFD